METSYLKNETKTICTRCSGLMNRLEPIYNLTLELNKLLDEPITAKSREVVITDLNRLLIKRGVEMENLNAPFSTEEQNLGEKLVPINEAVQRKMQVIF